jgi:hypothetical protein
MRMSVTTHSTSLGARKERIEIGFLFVFQRGIACLSKWNGTGSGVRETANTRERGLLQCRDPEEAGRTGIPNTGAGPDLGAGSIR